MPEGLKERFEKEFCVMLERYTSAYPAEEATLMIDGVLDYITAEVNRALDACTLKRKETGEMMTMTAQQRDFVVYETIGHNAAVAELENLKAKYRKENL